MAPLAASVALAGILFALQAVGHGRNGNAPRQATLACDAGSFASVMPPGAAVEKVAIVAEGGNYGEGMSDEAYPWIPTGLPGLCAVTVRVQSSPSSSFRFGLFLPSADRWKGRFLAVGNGGFSGGINWIDMAPGPHNGMASISTDTGHNSTALETSWALRNPEARTDWGWRAMHGSIVLGKALVSAYYNRPISYSYFSGCSTGGRQGLREMQAFPDSFDGMLVGAPAWWTTHLSNWITKVGTYNFPVTSPHHIPMALAPFIADQVRRQCDPQDGVTDDIVSDPLNCTFDPAPLLCPPVHSDPTLPATTSDPCLTPAQLTTLRHIYADYRSPTADQLIYPGLTLSSEPQWSLLLGDHTDPNATSPSPSPFGTGYARNFLLDDPTWDWRRYDDALVTLADELNPGHANADDFSSLRNYQSRGGKLLLYHGLADGLVPTKGSLLFYNKTIDAFGGDIQAVTSFFKLLLVPGMQHCFNTDAHVQAPWNFGGATQAGAMGMGEWSVPGHRDAKHDAMMAMMEWVERGQEFKEVVATAWNQLWNASSGERRQRPLCVWPGKAVWDGRGDVDDAGSWRCEGL
ncbi:Tannase/feruloyl esterase [Podospora aff. communis PSN243]|uniref:Carboxylic ester hydrolase n=1 Tax=Podospora aff. communis PSN243 TaxID=3040156 RepID=A0AAV9GD88_9PEZI|nr:Tannase/feruloyl esterase [Podospora aff. communis PSN243]